MLRCSIALAVMLASTGVFAHAVERYAQDDPKITQDLTKGSRASGRYKGAACVLETNRVPYTWGCKPGSVPGQKNPGSPLEEFAH